MIPASAASRPETAKTVIRTRRTGTPESRAAFSLPPMAYTCRAKAVLRSTRRAPTPMARNRTAGTGSTPLIDPLSSENASGASCGPSPYAMGMPSPPDHIRAMPRAAWRPARVTMNDWMPSRATIAPWVAPKAVPMNSTMSTVGRMPRPLFTISVADPTAASPSTAPTERSIPRSG